MPRPASCCRAGDARAGQLDGRSVAPNAHFPIMRGGLSRNNRTASAQSSRSVTTRPDIDLWVSYLVLPEHPLVGRLTAPEHA